MAIYQLLYVSGATGEVTAESLADILATARRNNARLGVTGMLLYASGAFVQVLEGEETTVKDLARRISHDRRHRNFMVLVEHDAESRAFADWQMGFKQLEAGNSEHEAVFRATERALEQRISKEDGGLMLDLVKAFGRDFLAAA
jgi:hypothetical protein